MHACIHPSIHLSSCKLENEAIRRDFLNFWIWQHQNKAILRDLLNFGSGQHQKRSNSARLPSKMNNAAIKIMMNAPRSGSWEYRAPPRRTWTAVRMPNSIGWGLLRAAARILNQEMTPAIRMVESPTSSKVRMSSRTSNWMATTMMTQMVTKSTM